MACSVSCLDDPEAVERNKNGGFDAPRDETACLPGDSFGLFLVAKETGDTPVMTRVVVSVLFYLLFPSFIRIDCKFEWG